MTTPLVAAAAPFIDWSWIATNERAIVDAIGQHIELTVIAIGAGLAISLPLALFAWQSRAARSTILGFAGLLYTIPSVALFVLVQPLTGFYSLLTAEIALTGYTLLILVRNLLVGLDGIPEEVREAAVASGYGRTSALVRVYFPLALPSLFAGLRVATVTVVGLVTITAFIDWGGLGQLIIEGFNESSVAPFYTPIVVGLVFSIALAGIGDAFFVLLERVTVRWHRERG